MKELEDVLKTIKKGKSRDPEGISREIFHPSVIGENLKEPLLIMFNLLKQQGFIPNFMKKDNISPIPKKGSQFLQKKMKEEFLLSTV